MEKKYIKLNIDEIKENTENPKKHVDELIEQSIERNGYVFNIYVDENNIVIAGHGRLRALKNKGYKEIEVVKIEGLTDKQKNELMLADNRLTELGGWDMKKLKVFEEDELRNSGFGELLDKIFPADPSEKDDEVPETPIEPESKLGEIYRLGNHFIMCGDSTSKEDVLKLMNNNKADMVFTDPPYNVNYSGRGKETSNTIENDNMSEADFDDFLIKTFQAYKEAVKISAPFYICHSSSSQIAFEKAMKSTDLIVKNQIIWNKTVASMGWGDYRWKHEPIFYATYGKKDVKFYGDRSQYTVWNESWDLKKIEKHLKKIAQKQEKGGSTVWTIGRDQNYKHPTQKPIELLEIAIKNSSKQEDIILDLFLGSGSTLIACEKFNRVCYGMELDPKYIDVIIKRWEEYTGQKAEKIN